MNCRVCGRQVEVSESGQSMPCRCVNDPLSQFLRYAVSTCVDPERDAAEPVEMSDLIGE